MIRQLFERKASYEAELLAEAQAFVDDGLDLDFVLGLFPDDAEWLEPMLTVAIGVEDAFESERPSYYFEASLKSQFLGAAHDPRPVVPVVIPAPAFSPVRTAVATISVASAAAAVGILSLGFITAGDSVPGDWNYTFKLANERFEYTLSRGDHRIDVQLRQAENRYVELNKLSERGDVPLSRIESIQREFDELKQLTKNQELDAMRRSQIDSIGKNAVAVINEVVTNQPELGPGAAAISAAIGDTVTALAPPPVATPTSEPPASPTPAQTATPAATGTATPAATTGTSTPEPSVTSTQQPAESETGTPSPTPSPSPAP